MFLNIERRGPDAFNNLVNALLEVDYKHQNLAYKLLGKDVSLFLPNTCNNNNNNDNEKCQDKKPTYDLDDNVNNMEEKKGAWPFVLTETQRPPHIRQISQEVPNANINLLTEPRVVKVKHSIKFYDDRNQHKAPVYAMRSKTRGLFLCINNIEFINNTHDRRDGAEVDEQNLKSLFTQMGFNVHTRTNQSKLDMKMIISNFTNKKSNPYLHKTDCIVVSIMSHGEEGDTQESSQIITADARKIQVSWILEQFNNVNCPALINKPKIFIFQICR